jgi:protein-tyrosine phosphatase
MKEKYKKRLEEYTIKSSDLNGQNKVDKIFLNDLMPDYRKISIKEEDSNKNIVNKNRKITVTKQMQFSPCSPNYKTESFNSYRYHHKPKIILTDNISEKIERNEFKKLPISREKKIYLYLKNRSNKNTESNLTIKNKPLLQNQEDFSDNGTLNTLNESKKRQNTDGNYNRRNIINRFSNNSVNNIFVNIISASSTNDFSRNLVTNKFNNSILNTNNNGKETQSRRDESTNSKVLKEEHSQPKLNIKTFQDKEKSKNYDYYNKIMFTANSFIFGGNNPQIKMNQQQSEPQKLKINRNNEEPMSKEKLKKSKKFLKDYILKKKMKQMKNKKENSKNHNNSFSCDKNNSKGHAKKKNNQGNPIFINIISKDPFMDGIKEDKKIETPIGKPKKRLVNSNTARVLVTKYSNLRSNIVKDTEYKESKTLYQDEINKVDINNRNNSNKKNSNNNSLKNISNNSKEKNTNIYNNINTYNKNNSNKNKAIVQSNNINNINIINNNKKLEKHNSNDIIIKDTNINNKINNNTINNIIIINANKTSNNNYSTINNINSNNKINNYISVSRSGDIKNINKSDNSKKTDVNSSANFRRINNNKTKDISNNNNTEINSKDKKIYNNTNILFTTKPKNRFKKNFNDNNVIVLNNNNEKNDNDEKIIDEKNNTQKNVNIKNIIFSKNYNTFNNLNNDYNSIDSNLIHLQKNRNINKRSSDNKNINDIKNSINDIKNDNNNNKLFNKYYTDSKIFNQSSQKNNNEISENNSNINNISENNKNTLNSSTKINVTKNNIINKNTISSNVVNTINNTTKNINDNNQNNKTNNLNNNNGNINVIKNYKMYNSTNNISKYKNNNSSNINNTNNYKLYNSLSNNNTNSYNSKKNSIVNNYNNIKSNSSINNSAIKNINIINNHNIITENDNIINNSNFIIGISKNNYNRNITNNNINDTNYNTFYMNKVDNLTNMQEYKKNLNMTSPNRKYNKESYSKNKSNANSSNISLVSSPNRNAGITSIIIIKPTSKEKRMNYIKSNEKSLFLGGQKKECIVCHKYIETHLLRIHLNSHPSQIFNWMFLGTFTNACDKYELRRIGIKYILNCAAECNNKNLPKDIKELHLNIRDEKWFDLIDFFEEANTFMNKVKMNGGIILVHCKFGISRSATFIIAYLIKYYGFSVKSALQFIKAIRNQINPNEGFIDQLMKYERLIKSQEKQLKK